MQRFAPIAISLSQELLEWVDTRAERHGVSRSAYVQQLIRHDLASGATTDDPALGKTAGIPQMDAQMVFEKVKATRSQRRAALFQRGNRSQISG